MTTRHRLFGELAHRYDLHTPAHHYQDDHALVLELAREAGGDGASLLDVGCGTGVLLTKARAAGMDALGFDVSAGMVAVCEQKLGSGVVTVAAMETFESDRTFDLVCALSWTLNYVESDDELDQVVQRLANRLAGHGALVLQVAHASNADGTVHEDREPAEGGEVTLFYRFRGGVGPPTLYADYVYAWPARDELLFETHTLRCADVELVAAACRKAGLADVGVYDSFRRDSLGSATSPLVIARRTAAHC